MPEKFNINDILGKRDLETILEVNRKAIEVQTEVADQNEEIIDSLSELQKHQARHGEKLDKIITNSDKIIVATETISRDLFRAQVLLITGLLSLVMQIIQIFAK